MLDWKASSSYLATGDQVGGDFISSQRVRHLKINKFTTRKLSRVSQPEATTTLYRCTFVSACVLKRWLGCATSTCGGAMEASHPLAWIWNTV